MKKRWLTLAVLALVVLLIGVGRHFGGPESDQMRHIADETVPLTAPEAASSDTETGTVTFDGSATDATDGEDHTVSVHVEAEEGAFSEGVTMSVETVDDPQILDSIRDAVEEETGTVHAVSITFTDESGAKVQPEEGYAVSVTLSSDAIPSGQAEEVSEPTESAGSDLEEEADPASEDKQEESEIPPEEASEAGGDMTSEPAGTEPVREADDQTKAEEAAASEQETEAETSSSEVAVVQYTPEDDVAQTVDTTEEAVSLPGGEVPIFALVEVIPEQAPEEEKEEETEEVREEEEAQTEEEKAAEEVSKEEEEESLAQTGSEPEEETAPGESGNSVPVGDVPPETPEMAILTAEGDDYFITVAYGPEALIPDGAALSVRELMPETEEYDEHITQTQEILDAAQPDIGAGVYAGPTFEKKREFFGARSLIADPERFDQLRATPKVPEEIVMARFFDITIVHNGSEIEPAAPVKVSIDLMNSEENRQTLQAADNTQVVHFAAEPEMLDADVDGDAVSFDATGFSVYGVIATTIEKNVLASDGHNYHIKVTCGADSGIPQDADLSVKEILSVSKLYEEYVSKTENSLGLENGSAGYIRLFDISIVGKDGKKIQPAAGKTVDVSIELADAEEGKDLSVVHFSDAREEGNVLESTTDGQTVTFQTDSFSAYAVVQGPSSVAIGWTQVKTLDDVKAYMEQGFGLYIGTTGGYYMTNTTAPGSQDKNTTGIVKTKPASSYPDRDTASMYYFEPAEGASDQFYVYCLDGDGNKLYVRNTGDANLTLTDEANKTAFTIDVDKNGRFRFYNGNRYWNMWNGANGNHIAAWTSATDGNNYFYVWQYEETTGDPYELDGAAYGLMNWNESASGRAMMASSSAAGNLDALALTVMSKAGNNADKLFVPDDSDISMWTFRWTGQDDLYFLASVVDGVTKYLKITPSGLSLVSEPDDSCRIQVIPGSGAHEGEICLRSGNATLAYSGKISTGFKTGGSAGAEWLRLVETSELTSEYFLTHSAGKVGVSDESVTNGSRIIVYTRVWNDTTKRYEFYAVDHDGSLVRCYESGDDIQWVGPLLNSMLWNFVEYYWEGTSDPNYYYDLYNQYSEKYISPQMNGGQVLSDSPTGLLMDGRRDGQYYSDITTWDDPNYAYTGLKADITSGRVVTCPGSEADDFYFAIVQDIPVDDALHTVSTVDSAQQGITMRLADFGSRKEMSDFLGSDAGGAVNNTDPNLLSTSLGENGYPTTKAGNDLSSWFANAREVNHLFIESTYKATGYYEYDSSQNFASLKNNNFLVYKEIGTVNNSGVHYQHGQFFPYNDLQAGLFASTSPKNLTTAGGSVLPESDPRKYEQLYLVKNQNYYLGMEVEASFTQTPNGEDDWGHDIIYEFTGDDDFWLYVDGELIIDLGGIHNALSGSVNYKTGDVYVNGVHYTLRELFTSNYKNRNPNATAADVEKYLSRYFDEGSTIFKDYTTHTMKIFYLERGAGASNLHMRFNLASVKPGTVELSKSLGSVDSQDSVLAEFAYQIKYKTSDGNEHYLSNMAPNDPHRDKDHVFYKNTVNPVTYETERKIGGVTYNDVFIIKPGQTAVINFPTEIASYSIVECGVNTDVFKKVKANGAILTGTQNAGTGSYQADRQDFATSEASTSERASVAYTNDVNPDALRTLTIRKKLFDETGLTEIANDNETTFSFRLYLGTESSDNPQTASRHTYYVKDRNERYCVWNAQKEWFDSTDASDYSQLTGEQKAAAAFETSPNGSISKIPAGYTVEIRNVLAGTKFSVVERPSEIPDGYSFQKYEYFENGLTSESSKVYAAAMTGVSDTVAANKDPHVDICNLKGWGLRVNKIWRDADYMSAREDTYFGVFVKKTDGLMLVDGTLRRLPYEARPQTLYWYFDRLPVAETSGLDDYVIREVTIGQEDLTVNREGCVTNADPKKVSVIGDESTVTLGGTQKGETSPSSFDYTVEYAEGEISSQSNVRVDTVTNDRPGIILKKQDFSGEPLAGAVFTLTDQDGNLIETFASDADGVITTAFLSSGKTYTLTETKTPARYCGLQAPLRIVWNNGQVEVSGADKNDYTLSQASGTTMATLIVKNRPYTLRAVKLDGDTHTPLKGVTFQLHKQYTVNGVTSFETAPLAGYDNLVTDDDGYIPRITEELPAGTYQLREKEAPNGYELLDGYIDFTISETGMITLGSTPDGVKLSDEADQGGKIEYQISVPNRKKVDVVLKKVDSQNNDLNGAKFQLCKYNKSWEAVRAYSEIDLTNQSEIKLEGLTSGLYRLKETKVPDGYIVTDPFVYFKIADEGNGFTLSLSNESGDGENQNACATAKGLTITVRNDTGTALPATGGPGTIALSLLGSVLITLSGTCLIISRRRFLERSSDYSGN